MEVVLYKYWHSAPRDAPREQLDTIADARRDAGRSDAKKLANALKLKSEEDAETKQAFAILDACLLEDEPEQLPKRGRSSENIAPKNPPQPQARQGTRPYQ